MTPTRIVLFVRLGVVSMADEVMAGALKSAVPAIYCGKEYRRSI
jgi:hypothetical protein